MRDQILKTLLDVTGGSEVRLSESHAHPLYPVEILVGEIVIGGTIVGFKLPVFRDGFKDGNLPDQKPGNNATRRGNKKVKGEGAGAE